MAHDKRSELPTHPPGARKGEEVIRGEGREPGRHTHGRTGADRPAGGRSARDSTAINPEDHDPIDPSMPRMPPA